MIAILQFHQHDGPATLATWLRSHGLAHTLVDLQRGAPMPARIDGIRALAALGGPMSVNDDLPMLRQAEALIRDALAHDVPVLGHCLGGQLLASALGGQVRRHHAPEIGWHEIQFEDADAAVRWFGSAEPAHVFQWHYDTFEIPAGARRLAGNAHCANQAFTVGRSVGMQFHIEIDASTLALWSEHGAPERVALDGVPSVQSLAQQDALTARHLVRSQAMAVHLYTRWLRDAGVLPA